MQRSGSRARTTGALQEYRAVSEPDLVRESGLFIAEGRLVVRRAIEDGRYRFRSLLLSETGAARPRAGARASGR